jgi:hypothetical protein
MTVIRQVYEKLPETIVTPAALKNRRVEVIMLPLDEADAEFEKPNSLKKQKNPIEEIIGAWEGEPLVRPDQGIFELREVLR